MKSFIAALRTLTLPFGADPDDERIILDGINGRIEIYGAGGFLFMTIDDNGIEVFDSGGDIRQRVAAITDFSSISFFDTDGDNASIITYTPIPGSNDYRALQIIGPSTDLEETRLLLLTPFNSATKNPLLQWDTGLLDNTGVAIPIADFTGFSRGDPRAAITVVDELKRGSSNGGGNAPTLGNSYPRGSMGKVEDTASSAAFSAATTIISGLDNHEVEAGRRYWVHFFARTINQSVALDTFELRIERDAGAGFAVISDGAVQLGAAGENIGPINIWASYDPATDATVDFRVRGERTGGTGTLAVGASATSPMYLEIFDAGSAV